MAVRSKKDPDGSLMYVVCSRCKEFLDTKPGNLGSLSHGLCRKCYEQTLAEVEKMKAARNARQE